jgi:hypothetical protein
MRENENINIPQPLLKIAHERFINAGNAWIARNEDGEFFHPFILKRARGNF